MFGADHNSFIACHIVANETSISDSFIGIVASNLLEMSFYFSQIQPATNFFYKAA